MSEQLHKRFTTEQVKTILGKYAAGEIKAREARGYMEISRSRFYQLVEQYRQDRKQFDLEYHRRKKTNQLDPKIEKNILDELAFEKKNVIDNPDVPTRWYNYTYIQEQLRGKYKQKVSVPTIIDRAQKYGYWKGRPPKKKHEREVVTNYTGELIQHDSSFHLWAPDSGTKWYLITSLDDFSRLIMYARFVEKDTTWQHILALQQVFLTYGTPLSYYVDRYSVFKYVKERDQYSPWKNYSKFTGDVETQWEQVLKDCGVKSTYALSPQAKGKIERPYEWLQDHVVRTCVRQQITNMSAAQIVLDQEVADYNARKVHSTTGEVPLIRYQKAIKEERSLFREFKLRPAFQSVRDIFCLRMARMVDSYRTISINNFKLKISGVGPREYVELRMYPDLVMGIVEVRIWHEEVFVESHKVKLDDLPIVQF